jgi:AmmeMemoRadiSam system protein B
VTPPEPRRARTLGPAVAGTWYAADPAQLRAHVAALLDAGGSQARDGAHDAAPLALVAPHAGFEYSGAVAARGFATVRGQRFERVVVIGPSHYAGFRGAALPEADALATPLGTVALDQAALGELARRPGFQLHTRAFVPEHCLEAELPFLQQALAPGWKLVPILVGAATGAADAAEVAGALRPFVDETTLVVASSDFTHFGKHFGFAPFDDRLPENIEALDRGAIERIERWDASGFDAYCASTGATICGRAAIAVLLRLYARAAARLLAYDTSGRMTGDWNHTVSYAAIAVRRTAAA